MADMIGLIGIVGLVVFMIIWQIAIRNYEKMTKE